MQSLVHILLCMIIISNENIILKKSHKLLIYDPIAGDSNSNLPLVYSKKHLLAIFNNLCPGVYRRPKPSAEAEGFNPLASASAAEVLWPKVWPKVKV